MNAEAKVIQLFIEKHLGTDHSWRIDAIDDVTVAARTNVLTGEITFSDHWVRILSYVALREVTLHEIAHVIQGNTGRLVLAHGEEWRKTCVSIGGDPDYRPCG